MIFLTTENNILKIVRYGPIIFVITLSIIFTQIFITKQSEYLDRLESILKQFAKLERMLE